MESDADVLSINNIKEVLDELWDYRARWKFIGIQLHIDTGTLDAIEKDCKTVDDCLLMMIKDWLRNSPRPTREIIKVALRSRHVSNAAGIIMQASLIIIIFYNDNIITRDTRECRNFLAKDTILLYHTPTR